MHKRLILTAVLAVSICAFAQAQDSPCQILWHPIIQLTDSTYSSFQPKIALSGDDTVHVTWWENYHQHRIPYLRSTTGGETWEPIRELATNTLLFPYRFAHQQIATDGDKVYLFSAGEPLAAGPPPWTPQPIAMSKSMNRGTSWTTVRIGTDSAAGLFSVTTHRDTLTIVYAPYKRGFVKEPRLLYSTNGGQTWAMSPDTTLNGRTNTAYTTNTLHLIKRIVFGYLFGIIYYRSFDLGQTYEHSIVLTAPDGDALENAMASDLRKRLVVAWREGRHGCFTIVGCSISGRETNDNGDSWNREEILTDIPDGYDPSLAVHKDMTVASWTSEDQMWNQTAIVRVRTGLQSQWSQPFSVGRGGQTSVAVSDKAVHVVWTDIVDNSPPEKWGVFYRRGEFIRGSPGRIGYRSGLWNLVSHPLRSASPMSLPSLYRYDGTYIRTGSMEEGRGYWAKPETDTVNYEGIPLTSLDIPLKRGWNIVGSISCPVLTSAVSTEPDGILTSPFFDYRNGQYEAASRIEPGRAYWVRAGESGTLRLSSDLAEQDRARSTAVAVRSISSEPGGDALPPPPPDADSTHPTSHIPQNFNLEQNYPNPFNPLTVIRYSLPVRSHVELKVYDVLGREVARLAEADREPGYHEISWDAADLPGGVYYVKLRAGEFTETRAAVVVK